MREKRRQELLRSIGHKSGRPCVLVHPDVDWVHNLGRATQIGKALRYGAHNFRRRGLAQLEADWPEMKHHETSPTHKRLLDAGLTVLEDRHVPEGNGEPACSIVRYSDGQVWCYQAGSEERLPDSFLDDALLRGLGVPEER